ncbi:uncharacterized protein LOC131236845 isoform X2 [Magnolia sinica]|uniref:uncharacterized protein LOC131236845 isoform X2 n=1 Tax=Magnolia sinica TaxID=86752 RepID=UPI0026590F9B|nr:uncharacterized protein LOC131236845 isoform X2 [Magnolia sinica]
MQRALMRTSRNVEEVADGRSTLSKKSLGRNSCKFSPKDPVVPASLQRDSEERWIILTFFTVEVDAPLKNFEPFLLPLQGPEHRNCLGSGDQLKMDGLDQVSQPPAIWFRIYQQRAEVSDPPGRACSAKPFTTSSSSGVNVPSRNRGSVNRRTKAAKVSVSYCQQNCNASNDSSGSVYNGSSATCSADLAKDVPKVDKPIKGSSKKKVKRKGKLHKKPSSHSIGATTACKEGIHSTSAYETYADNESAYGEVLASENATGSDLPFQKPTVEKVDNEGSSNDVLNFSAATTATTSCSDEVDDLETAASLPQDFTTNMNHATSKILSDFAEEAANAHLKRSCNRDDFCSGNFSDEYSTLMLDSYSDEISAQIETLERLSNTIDSEASSLKSEDDNSWKKVSGKSKRKPSSGSKQEHNHSSRKGAHTSKPDLTRSARTNLQWKEASENLSPLNYRRSVATGSRSPCQTDRRRVGVSPTDRVNFCPSEPLQNSEVCSGETKSLHYVPTIVSDMHAQTALNRISPFSRALNSSEQMCQLEVDSDGPSKFHKDLHGDPCFPTGNAGNGPANLEHEVPHPEYRKQDQNFGSILQKWIPVEKKDAVVLKTSRSNDLSTSHLDVPAIDHCCLRNIEEKSSANSYCHVSLPNTRVTCLGPSYGIADCSSPGDEGQSDKLKSQMPSIPIEHSSMYIASNCRSIHKSKDQSISAIETDSDKIVQVVNDAYRLQIESEGVQLATGSPLAEFERLLHSASPVLEETHSVRHCNICSGNRLIGDSLCRHQIPNISLRSLWQWYEGPGSYGLEVKAEEYHNSKRLGSDHFEFRAYFVPFLSALQLFGHSRSSTSASHAMPSSELMKTCDVDATSDILSNLSHLPNSSMQLPQLCREERRSSSLPVSSLHNSDTSFASGQDEACNSSSCVCDSDLLFQYFESEQPQQRRPLFENRVTLNNLEDLSIRSPRLGDSRLTFIYHLQCLSRISEILPSTVYSISVDKTFP